MSPDLIQVLTSVLSGSASAATTFAAFFRDISRRLRQLETKLVSTEETSERLEESVRRIKRELDRWPDETPDWLVRAIRRTVNSGGEQDFLEQRLKSLSSTITRMEKDLADTAEAIGDYVRRQDYDKDVLERAKELSAIREQIATSNGLLKGIMSALDYIYNNKPAR